MNFGVILHRIIQHPAKVSFYPENRIQGNPLGTKLGAAPPPSPSAFLKSLSIPLFFLLVFEISSPLFNLLQSTMDVKALSDPSSTSLQQTDAANDRPRLEPGPPERLLEKLGFCSHPILYAPLTPSVVRTNNLTPAGSWRVFGYLPICCLPLPVLNIAMRFYAWTSVMARFS